MANRIGKLPKLVYVPAVAPIAARAAYCVNVTTYLPYAEAPRKADKILTEDDPELSWVDYADDPSEAYIRYTYGYYPYAPATITNRICYPAITGRSGSPSRIDVLDSFSWDAGARSIAPIPESGYFRAELPFSPIGTQFGFSYRGFASSGLPEMTHSLVARRAFYTIVESGVVVHGPAALPASAQVELRRTSGVVSYRINGTEVYESGTLSSGETYGAALLYSTGDFADSPEIGEVEVPIAFAAEFPGLVAAISDVADYSAALLEAPTLLVIAVLDAVEGDMQFSGVLPAMRAGISSTGSAAWVNESLPALSLRASLGVIEEIPSHFIAALPPPIFSASLHTGAELSLSISLRPAFVASDDPSYSFVDSELSMTRLIRALEPYLPADEIDGSEGIVARDVHTLESAMLLVGLDSLEVGGTASITIILELAGMDSLSLSDEMTLGSIVEMLAIEQVSIMSHAGAARQQALQYSVNYLTGALTTYQDFDFTGFTHHEGAAFAWRADGLYRLGTEGEETMRLLADFGATDYGEAKIKHAVTGFVGVRADGQCYLRIAADDGIERVYSLAGTGNQRRARLAKGVESRFWNVRLELEDASFATIDNIELEVGVAQRRSASRRF
jgi:hypothetical protein